MALDITLEKKFQSDIIEEMQASGWNLGSPEGYNRTTALYEKDLIEFVKKTQKTEWEKFCSREGADAQQKFIEKVVTQLKNAPANDCSKALREYGTLGLLRKGLKTLTGHFKFCQFKPEHGLNEETKKAYKKNKFTLVPELVYSPYTTKEHLKETGSKAKAYRIDLVLFVNGIPVSTLELKSEFKQEVERAITQYKTTRLPNDPTTKKTEPLLTFKRGALVHFAVSQYKVFMTTRLDGKNTFFLPFNKGMEDGSAENEIPEDVNQYATGYLWQEVLQPDSLMNILARFIHLQIEDKEDYDGRKYKKETMIFPRYHQLDVVNKILDKVEEEGTGNRYLIQHSAGSGKSNSIAWAAHQLSSLHKENGDKVFQSVIVITDRTVLDDQLQDTISQFTQVDGVVTCITNKVGQGTKSEKLADALKHASPIIIVTIQTFSHVVDAIEMDVELSKRSFAVIADEAHSSQTGRTAIQLKNVLKKEAEQNAPELDYEDKLALEVELRKSSKNLNYYAFTATPKDKTLQLFGRLPNPDLPPSKKNKPRPFHLYQMRQAIEEGFILDVLQNYTSYKVAYNLAQKIKDSGTEVDGKKAKVKLSQWVELVEHNVAQKVKVIVEHFNDNVLGLLEGQAKAMVVTSSRKAAVRFKLEFDKYVTSKGYKDINALVAFSGDVSFDAKKDPDVTLLLGETFTESNMNPGLNKRKLPEAFDSNDYQVMLVANKFQTGFDQPKLCAMYVDKPLGGVECVQTLSRLNRVYPGKKECGTFVLDFCNEPDDILKSFQDYYQEAELEDVSDPDLIFKLENSLKASGIFLWEEVEKLCKYYHEESKSGAAVSNICKAAVERWQKSYSIAVDAYLQAKDIYDRVKNLDDEVLIANAKTRLDENTKEKDRLENFKKDLGSYVRFYDFMSQIVDYANTDLEKLSLYARHLRPLLKLKAEDQDEVDLSNVAMTHYRLSKKKQKQLKLKVSRGEYLLKPTTDVGSSKAKSKQEEFLEHIIEKLNSLFISEGFTDADRINFFYSVRDKLSENKKIMLQLVNNTKEQALLGDFPDAFEDALIDTGAAFNGLLHETLEDELTFNKMQNLTLDSFYAEKEGLKPKFEENYISFESIKVGEIKLVVDGEFGGNSFEVASDLQAVIAELLASRMPEINQDCNVSLNVNSIRPGSILIVFGVVFSAVGYKLLLTYPKLKKVLTEIIEDVNSGRSAVSGIIDRALSKHKLGKIDMATVTLVPLDDVQSQLEENDKSRNELNKVAEPKVKH